MVRLVLEVPELPNMQLGANQRRRFGFRKVARLTREERERWYALLLDAWVRGGYGGKGRTLTSPVRLTWELTFPTRQIPDDDNVQGALKPIRDTMCRANMSSLGLYLGFVEDDSPAHIVSTTLTQRYERGVRRTRITLEEVGR